jgi:ribosome biogenesis SPOUT family RNA methylase Rps3
MTRAKPSMQQLRLQATKQSFVMDPGLSFAIILLQRANKDLIPESVDHAELVILEKLLGCVSPRYLLEDLLTPRMLVLICGDIQDLAVHNDPQIFLGIMLAHFSRRE